MFVCFLECKNTNYFDTFNKNLQIFQHFFADECSSVAVAENLREIVRRILHEIVERFYNSLLVSISDYCSSAFHYFFPFSLGAQDEAWLLEEKRFFLHAARVGDNYLRMTLQDYHVQKRCRRQNLDVRIVCNLVK